MALKKDKNFETTYTRQGPPIGGKHVITTPSSPSTPDIVDDWIRLCPSGNKGKRVAGNPKQLDLSTAPAFDPDSVISGSLDGWYLRILNAGFPQVHEIVSGSTTVTLLEALEDTVPDEDIEWVVYPEVLFPISIRASASSTATGPTNTAAINLDTDRITVGYIREDVYDINPSSPVVSEMYGELKSLNGGTRAPTVEIRTSQIDRLAFRFNAAAITNTRTIYWGEYTVRLV